MGLTDLLKDAGRALTLTAALYSCGGEEKEGCSTDYDCREPRVCVRGYCEGGNSPGNDGDFSGEENICWTYLQVCPKDADNDYREKYFKDDCLRYCVGDWENSDAHAEDCWFIACAVQTGYCYNEVLDNPQILACVDKNNN